MYSLLQSLRYTTRLLLKSPGFTIAAVLILGFGIGVNTAIFSLINTVLLNPLPFPKADRLVQIFQSRTNNGLLDRSDWGGLDYSDYVDLRDGQQSVASVSVQYWDYDPVSLGLAIVALGLAGLLACLLPALRATRINPITALRE
jgi:ABC-type antimicrobial peptide transport system permease subunit